MTTITMDPEVPPTTEMTFNAVSSAAPVLAPRVGTLALAGRKTISTPHHIPLTTRGAVSHLAHDAVRKETAINNIYVGLEDCMYTSTLGS